MNFFNPQKKHYKAKILVTQKKVWDLLFLRDQYLLMREGFRLEYDKIKEKMDALVTYRELINRVGMEKAKEIMKNPELAHQTLREIPLTNYKLTEEEKSIIETLNKNEEGQKGDIEKLKKQMETLDLQMEGPLPPGQQCLNEQISGLKGIAGLLKEKIKKL